MDVEKLAAHTRGIRALARSLLRDEAQVDDVIQEASLAALRLPEMPARGWWIKVVRNLALRRRRSEGRRARREQAVARREGTPATSEVVARAEVHRRLVACVLDLDEPYRSILLLRYFDSLSLKEIAARLGIPVATVSTRVRRALALLRGRLDASPGGRRAWCLSLLPLAGLTPRSPLPLGVAAMSTKKILSLAAVALLLATLLLTFHHFGSQAPQETRTQAGARHDVSADTADPDTAVTAPAPDRDLDLHGVVVDPAGRPVAGATVTAFWDPWKRARVGDPTKGSRFEDGPTATTDADGRFALRLRRGQRVNLRVNAEGFARRELNYLQAGERIRIVLTPGVTLIVDVQDHEGRPADGASLHLLRGERDGLDRIDRRGTTDERGRHRFGGLPPAAWAMLNGRHAELGNLPWQMRVGFPARGERVHVVRIPPGRTLRGVVLDDETGAPVARARLSGSGTIDFLVRTNEAGRFEMPGWGSNSEFMVTVAADGYV
ncbi:MAG: sigma-70 family RNA polymerase sigma factor, partial [Planctomycetota bacterium]|nr:sigma-70 family RNA polymerase sigma factor [Planctomycetota bacterium]